MKPTPKVGALKLRIVRVERRFAGSRMAAVELESRIRSSEVGSGGGSRGALAIGGS
jgi:hypothetical protein